jgi:AbrB family looped-hinge helix DNA binding protein
MPKVTSKLQLTVPKAIADQYGIRPGDELQWVAAGEVIRVIPANKASEHEQRLSLEQRLELFDKATLRQHRRQAERPKTASHRGNRGWKREDLYDRGFPR